MEKRLVLETESASLWYYPAERIIHHQFRQFVHGACFRVVLEQGLGLMQKHGAEKWLSDDRKNGAVTAEDREWLTDTWEPAALAAGWKVWAMVRPEVVVGQMSIRRFTERAAAKGLKVKVFDSPVPALSWLVKA